MAAAITLFVFGAITAALSLQLPLGTLRMPGSGFFPLALSLLLMGLAALHAERLRRAARKAAQAAGSGAEKAQAKAAVDGATARVALFMGVVVACTAALKLAGYVAVSFLLMLGLLRVLGLSWGRSALIAVVSAAAAHVVFVQWLMIPLPAGPLGF